MRKRSSAYDWETVARVGELWRRLLHDNCTYCNLVCICSIPEHEVELREETDAQGSVGGDCIRGRIFLFIFDAVQSFWRSFVSDGRRSLFWTYGWRMLQGQVFLRDFHQFTPPGTDLVYETVFRYFGSGMQSINWTLVGLGVALTVVSFIASLQVVRIELAALAAVLCFLFLYADRFDGTHHWFSSLANLLAVIVLSRTRTFRRIAAAGFLLAVSAFFTQTAGVMGLLACSGGLLWRGGRRKVHGASR